jgi:hypothetical protein
MTLWQASTDVSISYILNEGVSILPEDIIKFLLGRLLFFLMLPLLEFSGLTSKLSKSPAKRKRKKRGLGVGSLFISAGRPRQATTS